MGRPSRDQTAPRYVIVREEDRPCPDMICQWVKGVGYCYMDRVPSKIRFDGMLGRQAMPVEAFGFGWSEQIFSVYFFLTGQRPYAICSDGLPRSWQSDDLHFTIPRLRPSMVKKVSGEDRPKRRKPRVTIHPPGYLTAAQKKAIAWLPENGDWKIRPGRLSSALVSLSSAWPDCVESQWGQYGPRGGAAQRWRLNQRGVEARRALGDIAS